MQHFKNFARAAAIAVPLAFTGPAEAVDSTSPTPTVARVVQKTRIRANEAQDFQGEVRDYLVREKCYALTHPVKNSQAWLSAIGKFNDVNERAGKKLSGKEIAAFENAKAKLETERVKAGISFTDMMDAERMITGKEAECLSGKGFVKS